MTDPFAALTAAAAAAVAEGAALQSQAQALTAQVAADQQTIAQQTAQIADLEAQLHPATLFGANTSTPANFGTVARLLAPVGVWRYYLQPGERPHPPTELPITAGAPLILSSKIRPQDIVTGRWDADFASLFAALGDSWFCPWHEPADDVERGAFTVAQYRAAWDHLTPLARKTKVRLAPILMRATYAGFKGRRPADFLPDDYDAAGVDAYVAGGIGVGVDQIGSLLDPVRAAAPGKPIVVAETGVGRKVTGQARIDALTRLAGYLRAAGDVAAVAYFLGNSPDKIEWGLSPAEAAAWMQAAQ